MFQLGSSLYAIERTERKLLKTVNVKVANLLYKVGKTDINTNISGFNKTGALFFQCV